MVKCSNMPSFCSEHWLHLHPNRLIHTYTVLGYQRPFDQKEVYGNQLYSSQNTIRHPCLIYVFVDLICEPPRRRLVQMQGVVAKSAVMVGSLYCG